MKVVWTGVAYLFGSCLGLGLIAAVGSIGYPAVGVGAMLLIACAVLSAKHRRFRVPAALGAIGCVFMMLIGLGSAGKTDTSTSGTTRTVQQASAEHRAAAIATLAASSSDMPMGEVLTLCERVSLLGGVPDEHAERCGTAFFTHGRALLMGDARGKGIAFLKTASQVRFSKATEAAALLASIELDDWRREAGELLKTSQAKAVSGDVAGAISTADAARKKAHALVERAPNDKTAVKLATAIDTHIERMEKERDRQATAKRREGYVKDSCSKVSKLFGPGSSLSDLQKEERWKSYDGRGFAWPLEVVEVSSGLLGGYVVQFKCGSNSPSLIQDIQISYSARAKDMVIKLQKGSVYEVEGVLTGFSTLLGMTADPI
jgi:hypothetical protein